MLTGSLGLVAFGQMLCKPRGVQMPKVQRAIGFATQVRVPRAMQRRFAAYYVGVKRAEEDSATPECSARAFVH